MCYTLSMNMLEKENTHPLKVVDTVLLRHTGVSLLKMRKIVAITLLTSCTIFTLSNTVVYAQQPAVNAGHVLAYTNAQRYLANLPLLSSNTQLSRVAHEKMLDLFANQYFAHESPQGDSVSDLAERNGYEYILVGENLAQGAFRSSKEVVEAWMDSPGHRKNILSDTYTEIGIAAGRGNYKGATSWMIVQSFGLPKTSCPTVDVVLEGKLKSFDERLEILGTIAEIRETQAQRTDGSLAERKRRVDSYNKAARMYNSYAEEYGTLVDEYNERIGDFNACLKEVKDHIAQH